VRLSEADRRALCARADEAALAARPTYSGLRVGAAVLSTGTHLGANIEISSYDGSVCAERVAIANAVVSGDSDIRAIAISMPDARSADDDAPFLPCGICRQWIAELAPTAEIIVSHNEHVYRLQDLLPLPYTIPGRTDRDSSVSDGPAPTDI